jgi:hypothetical protein
MSVLAHSRAELRLIVGHRDVDSNPPVPSRLLFAADEETVAAGTALLRCRAVRRRAQSARETIRRGQVSPDHPQTLPQRARWHVHCHRVQLYPPARIAIT